MQQLANALNGLFTPVATPVQAPDFAQMAAGEMVTWFNANHPSLQVKRFSDRTAAERRCKELYASLTADVSTETASPAVTTPLEALEASVDQENDMARAKKTAPATSTDKPTAGASKAAKKGNPAAKPSTAKKAAPWDKGDKPAAGKAVKADKPQAKAAPKAAEGAKAAKEAAAILRVSMQTSLKLDRTIALCKPDGTLMKTKQWANAHLMWKENQNWMTSSQQDRLTFELYAAAKNGEQKRVTIKSKETGEEHTFALVNVGAVGAAVEQAEKQA